MPALDPFSASSRPMKPFDSLPSEPLRFAATLRPIDQNADAGPSSKLPKPKKYKDDIPEVFPLPAYSHSPRASYDMRYLSSALDLSAGGYGKRSEQALIGGDAWMQDRVAQCVDSANGVLDIRSVSCCHAIWPSADDQRAGSGDIIDPNIRFARPCHASTFLFASRVRLEPALRLGCFGLPLLPSARSASAPNWITLRSTRRKFALIRSGQFSPRDDCAFFQESSGLKTIDGPHTKRPRGPSGRAGAR